MRKDLTDRLVAGLVLVIALTLTACGGGLVPEETGGDTGGNGATGGETGGDTGGDTGSQGNETTVPTLGAGDAVGKFYLGRVLPPTAGPAAMFIHSDGAIEMIIAPEAVDLSLHFDGQLEGQRVNLQSEVGEIRATGRVEEDEIGLNITIPGKGSLRVELEESQEGALYIGTLNDLTAGLIMLPDGTMSGFAAVEDGDEPVYEALCVEGGESMPPELTATTCDSGDEVTLAIVTD